MFVDKSLTDAEYKQMLQTDFGDNATLVYDQYARLALLARMLTYLHPQIPIV
jgi:hypothetical protein